MLGRRLNWSLMLGGILVFAAGAGVGAAVRPFSAGSNDLGIYTRQRPLILAREATAIGERGGILVVGDSIVERSNLHTLCNSRIFNAGISGARLQDILAPTRELSQLLQPRVIVVAVGMNDTRRADPTDDARWSQSYDRLIEEVRQRGQLFLVGIPTPESGKALTDYFGTAAHIARKNALIERLARKHRVNFIRFGEIATVDGVHPTAAGAAQWRAIVERSLCHTGG